MAAEKLLVLCVMAYLAGSFASLIDTGNASGEIDEVLKDKIEDNLDEFLKEGFEKAEVFLKEERKAADRIAKAPKDKLTSKLSRNRKTSKKSKLESACHSLGLLETSLLIKDTFNIDKDSVGDLLESIAISLSELPTINGIQECKPEKTSSRKPRSSSGPCDANYPYRRIDGSCNDLTDGKGAAFQPFKRYLTPAYDDGLNVMRGSSTNDLPNPRKVSSMLSQVDTSSMPSFPLTQMLKLWGQFMDHDMTFTAETQMLNSEGELVEVECCDGGSYTGAISSQHTDCRPIDVTMDPFFSSHGVSCLRFVRSLPVSNNLGPREQVNELTSFIDASNVYGSEDVKAQELRDPTSGKLKVNLGAELNSCLSTPTTCLPFLPETTPQDLEDFFTAGDGRVNEQGSLTTIHNLFVRYHNLLAEEFYKIDSSFSSEFVYQETRRIVGAVLQRITYTEFLAVVLGDSVWKQYNLDPSGYGLDLYDSTLDPSIANGFATAAFRFGHTLVTDNIRGSDGTSSATTPLVNTFFNTQFIKTNSDFYPSKILKGECELAAEKIDVKLVETLTNKLFADGPSFDVGSDLMALNIQRGRDHGIPGYNAWREALGYAKFNSFNHMRNYLLPAAVDVFEDLYKDVDDVDLFPAALAEYPHLEGIVGPVFANIIGTQFSQLKFGDRFWFENINQPKPFTQKQLDAIYSTSLATVLCEATTITSIQRWPMITMITADLNQNYVLNCNQFTSNSVLTKLTTYWGKSVSSIDAMDHNDGV